jgi:hypothetical protein
MSLFTHISLSYYALQGQFSEKDAAKLVANLADCLTFLHEDVGVNMAYVILGFTRVYF